MASIARFPWPEFFQERLKLGINLRKFDCRATASHDSPQFKQDEERFVGCPAIAFFVGPNPIERGKDFVTIHRYPHAGSCVDVSRQGQEHKAEEWRRRESTPSRFGIHVFAPGAAAAASGAIHGASSSLFARRCLGVRLPPPGKRKKADYRFQEVGLGVRLVEAGGIVFDRIALIIQSNIKSADSRYP